MAAAGLLREEAMAQLQLLLGARAVPKRLAFAAMGENSAVSLRAAALEAGNPRPRSAQGRRRGPSHHSGAEPAGRHQPPPPPSRPPRLRPSLRGPAPPRPARCGEGRGGAVPSLRLTQRAGGGAEVRRRRRRKWLCVWGQDGECGLVVGLGRGAGRAGPERVRLSAPLSPSPSRGRWGPRGWRPLGEGRWGPC